GSVGETHRQHLVPAEVAGHADVAHVHTLGVGPYPGRGEQHGGTRQHHPYPDHRNLVADGEDRPGVHRPEQHGHRHEHGQQHDRKRRGHPERTARSHDHDLGGHVRPRALTHTKPRSVHGCRRPRNTFAVVNAAIVASRPLSSTDSGSPALASACSSVSQVSTPLPTGVLSSSATRVSPAVTASHTYSKWGVPPRITTPNATTAS